MASRLTRVTVGGSTKIIDLLKTVPLNQDGLLTGWSNVVIRGGGFVTGLDTGSGVVYARTDVGGCYRYDPAAARWTQLLTVSSVTSGRDTSDYEVDGIAAAPTNSNIVCALVGASSGGTLGRVLRSRDGGRNWTPGARSWYVGGNEGNRTTNPRIVYDPANPEVVYIGTRKNGLQLSTDGGATFAALPIPSPVGDAAGTGAVGVNALLIDPAGPVVDGRYQVIWAAVFGVGLARSTDGGATWTTVYAYTGGFVSDIVRSSTGAIYFTAYNTTKPSSKILRVDGTTVTDITPGTTNTWATVAVDPSNPDLVIAAANIVNGSARLFRTLNASAATPTWTSLGVALANGSKGTAWPTQTTDIIFSMAAGMMRILNGVLYFAEGMGVWTNTTYATASTITWQHTSDGIEELVANVAHKPSGAALLTASWDRGIFRHSYPAKQLALTGQAATLPYTTGFGAAWDITSSSKTPSFVAAILDDSQDTSGVTYPARRASGYSTDGGRTWTRFGALTSGTAPSDMLFGNIAVSSGNLNNLVWVPSKLAGASTKIYYTTDRGATWTAATLTGLGSNDFIHDTYTKARRVLLADPNTAGTFYALGATYASNDLIVWKSVDQGATWTKLTTTGVNGGTASWIGDVQFRLAGNTFIACPGAGAANTAIYRSTDCVTWTAKATISGAFGVGVGKPMTTGGNPSLYTIGTISGATGLYRSTDLGDTWTYLAPAPTGLYQPIRALAGDPDISGRVYVGFAGAGFVAGQFA